MKIVKRFLAIVSLLLIFLLQDAQLQNPQQLKIYLQLRQQPKLALLMQSRRAVPLKLEFSQIKNRLVMLMTKENTKDMMFILQTV